MGFIFFCFADREPHIYSMMGVKNCNSSFHSDWIVTAAINPRTLTSWLLSEWEACTSEQWEASGDGHCFPSAWPLPWNLQTSKGFAMVWELHVKFQSAYTGPWKWWKKNSFFKKKCCFYPYRSQWSDKSSCPGISTYRSPALAKGSHWHTEEALSVR